MPKVEVGDLLEARHDRALSAAPERRVSEQLITEWEQERRRLRHALALMTLDVSAITGPKWAYRFIIAICPVVEVGRTRRGPILFVHGGRSNGEEAPKD